MTQTQETRVRTSNAVHLAAAFGITALFGVGSASADLTAIVPAYFYPFSGGSAWDDLNTAAERIPLTAIMNPGSGPGTAQNSDYVSAVNSLRTAGGKVIAYVSTDYGNRSSTLVKADVDKYVNWYNIDGIFFDEMTNTGTAGTLNYYQDIYDYVKAIDPTWEVMGNPGTTTAESYLTTPVADSLLVHENVGSSYPGYSPSPWNDNQDPGAIGHLIHTTATEADMLAYLDLAVARNAGQVYITDDVMVNPWDTLPTYWDAQVDRIEAINNAPPPGPYELSNPVPSGSIVVTGNDRGDWATIPAFIADDPDTAGPEVDYSQVQTAHDDDNFYFRFQHNSSGFFGFRHHVFIDIDQDRSTGFRGTGDHLSVGAEFMLEGSSVFSFAGATPLTWNWNYLGSQPYDDSPTTDIETMIPRDLIGDPASFDFMLLGSNTVEEDYYPNSADLGALGEVLTYLAGNPILGDLDGDGFVGLGDLDVILNNWNQVVPPGNPAADPTGDNFVGLADLDIVLNNWNAGIPPADQINIPEPAGLALWCLSVMGTLRRASGS